MQNQFVDNSSNGADLSGNDTKFTYVNLSGVGAGDSGANMAEAAVHAQATQLGQLPGGKGHMHLMSYELGLSILGSTVNIHLHLSRIPNE